MKDDYTLIDLLFIVAVMLAVTPAATSFFRWLGAH